MDLATILGLVVGMVLVIIAISLGDAGIASLKGFLDAPSALITFGGAFCAVLASNSLSEFVEGLKSIKLVFKVYAEDTGEMIRRIIDLSNVARKEGLLSLEEAAADLDDEFLKKGILLIVDGTDPELVRAIMETELASLEERHKGKVSFWESLAAMGPAWGMIGTLIGLINMLGNMDDPGALGPAMSTALLTTMYGSMLANWLCSPIANKMKANNGKEVMVKQIMIEGLLSIQAGENPRVIEEKLKSFVAPKDRDSANEGGDMNG